MATPARATIGRYELLLELGRGGMAVLHLARARGAGGFSKLFAIKQILPHLAADPPFVDMFLNEGRIAARLSHPNLCPVFELGQERDELFLVMEYLDGVPWEALAAAMPRDVRGLQLTAGVLTQVCEGLHYAHTFCDVDGTAMPIVHRDVSPQNVFVSGDGVCRVLDFGVSKISTDHRRTRTGVLKGKVPYMAPEQLRGEPVDGRADVWAVGVMLWEALAGRRLFDRDTDFLIYDAITSAEIPSVNADAPRYPEAIDRVIARALARDREHRYATARELGRDLQAVAAGIGGAASREQIAGAVGGLCGDQLAERKRAVATAVTGRQAAPPPGASSAVEPATRRATGATEGTQPAGMRPAGDAAATLSMAMRRASIVVARLPRRRRRGVAFALGFAALAAGVVGLIAVRGSSSPVAPVARALSGDPVAAIVNPSRAPSEDPVAAIVNPSRARSNPSPAPSEDPVAAIVNPSRAPSGDQVAAAAAPGDSAPAQDTPVPAADTDIAGAAHGSAAALVATHASANAPVPSRAGSTPPHSRSRERVAHGTVTHPDRPRTLGAAAPAAGATASAAGTAASAAGTAASAAGTVAPAAGTVAPAAAGWYAVDSSPYATIYIDDRKIGDTPLDRISLAAGAHRVRAVLADGRQRTFAIDIASDRKTSSGTLAW